MGQKRSYETFQIRADAGTMTSYWPAFMKTYNEPRQAFQPNGGSGSSLRQKGSQRRNWPGGDTRRAGQTGKAKQKGAEAMATDADYSPSCFFICSEKDKKLSSSSRNAISVFMA